MTTFVQFPHPGGEHCPESDDMPWNTGAHGRKFLISDGRYVDAANRAGQGELVFWGEWEPPSHVEHRWPRGGRLPRVLHRPYWVHGIGKNTDPWVFGDRMLYSNCRQVVRDERRPTSMQRLSPGSVICFGSTLDYEFCVDTVFVVAEAEPWTAAGSADLDEAFATCTAEQLAAGTDAHTPFTLYRAATIENPVHGMYSFVPASPADGEGPRFARPALRMPDLINPANSRNTRGTKWPLAVAEVRNAWNTVRDQVFEADLVLATHLKTPLRSTKAPASTAGKRVGCGDVQPVTCAGTVTPTQEVRPRERCSDVGAPLPSTVGRLT
jgi:hypothetical protein